MQRSPAFLAPGTDFIGDNFPTDLQGGVWNGIRMIQEHYASLHFIFFYYYLSSTSDPRGWEHLHQGNANQKHKYHLSPVRMAIIRKTVNSGMCRKGTLMHSWWECKLVQSLRKTVLRYPKNLKIELLYDPKILLLHIYLQKIKTLIRKYI